MKVFLGTLFLMFIFSVFTIELFLYANRRMRHANPTKLRKRVRGISTGDQTAVEALDILQKKRKLSSVPLLNSILWRIPGVGALDRLVEQANVKYPLSVFVLLAVVLALTGYFVVSHLMRNPAASAVAAILLGGAPLYLPPYQEEDQNAEIPGATARRPGIDRSRTQGRTCLHDGHEVGCR